MENNLFEIDDYTIERETNGSISETCNAGALAELKLCCAAAEKGFEVFTPLSHSTKTDLIIMKPQGIPIRVQVKKATYQKKISPNRMDVWKFMIGTGRPSCAANPTDYGVRYKKYVDGDFDVLAAYILERNTFAFYHLKEISGVSGLRWDASKRSKNASFVARLRDSPARSIRSAAVIRRRNETKQRKFCPSIFERISFAQSAK